MHLKLKLNEVSEFSFVKICYIKHTCKKQKQQIDSRSTRASLFDLYLSTQIFLRKCRNHFNKASRDRWHIASSVGGHHWDYTSHLYEWLCVLHHKRVCQVQEQLRDFSLIKSSYLPKSIFNTSDLILENIKAYYQNLTFSALWLLNLCPGFGLQTAIRSQRL